MYVYTFKKERKEIKIVDERQKR